jgi:hypothetical protein
MLLVHGQLLIPAAASYMVGSYWRRACYGELVMGRRQGSCMIDGSLEYPCAWLNLWSLSLKDKLWPHLSTRHGHGTKVLFVPFLRRKLPKEYSRFRLVNLVVTTLSLGLTINLGYTQSDRHIIWPEACSNLSKWSWTRYVFWLWR